MSDDPTDTHPCARCHQSWNAAARLAEAEAALREIVAYRKRSHGGWADEVDANLEAVHAIARAVLRTEDKGPNIPRWVGDYPATRTEDIE